MNFRNKTLKFLSSGMLSKNEKFKNRHQGETCYIIGNGGSLKSMDLAAFTDHIAIPLNFLCLHNDFKLLNAPYYVMSAPKYLYPFVLDSYTGKIRRNIMGKGFRDAFLEYSDRTLFTSITNKFGFNFPNETCYFHHFGYKEPNIKICDISTEFSFMKGGLHAGIGMAINMGFKKAILVGCDYMFTPISDGHFYCFGPSVISDKYNNVYESLLNETKGTIDLEIITDMAMSRWLPYKNYEVYTGDKLHYRENTEIVNINHLNMLHEGSKAKQYLGDIFKV